MQSLLILGRQPAFGLAELESLYGASALRLVGSQAAIVDVDPCLLAFDRLGGSVKFCKVLTELETTDWKQIEKFLVQASPGHSQQMPEGKMHLGLSVIGLDVLLKQLEATGLTLKKAIRKTGRPVRLVPNKALELNTAQVTHNKLTSPTGWELYFIRDGHKTVVAQTVKVQDIESYTQRDRGRPKRDTRVGMLPPKLAQILINLAAGELPGDMLRSICDTPVGQVIPRAQLNQTVLDPFCGTGVVLQEALLMGYDIYGTDVESRMIDYSQRNLQWFSKTIGAPLTMVETRRNLRLNSADCTYCQFEVGDATAHKWASPSDLVATETYLGRPFTAPPDPQTLARTVADCNLIVKKFLQNLHGQLTPGTRLCLAVPAWQIRPDQFKHLPLIDQISDLGYNQVSFEHVAPRDLLYYRADQIVARQLLVLTRK